MPKGAGAASIFRDFTPVQDKEGDGFGDCKQIFHLDVFIRGVGAAAPQAVMNPLQVEVALHCEQIGGDHAGRHQ